MEEKMTYAQRMLFNLVVTRNLKAWCDRNGLSHPTVYKIAVGDTPPTYSAMCQMLPYIAPALWVYYEGETIPYETRILSQWDPSQVSSFVRRHKHDYLETAKKYELTEAYARNLFVNHRARPGTVLIRKAAFDGINPEEFFIEGDLKDDGRYYPDRGDIVSISGKKFLVLTKQADNRNTSSITGITLNNDKPDMQTLETITYIKTQPVFIEKAEPSMLSDVLKLIRQLFL